MFTPSEIARSRQTETPEAKQKLVYSTHAAGQDVILLPALLKRLDALLADIRFAPAPLPLERSKPYLKLLLKEKYLHMPALGNRGGTAEKDGEKPLIQNLSLGIKIIVESENSLILFCACASPADCHRRTIAAELEKSGIAVTEITDWKSTARD